MEKAIIVTKQNEVKELAEKMNASSSVIVLDYRGLSVEQITTLRSQLREEGCEMKVIKNNITKRAAQAIGQEGLVEHLSGPNAVAFGTKDSVAAAKIIYNFAKENEALELKAGIVDGTYTDLDTLTQLAQLPSRDVLLTMLAGSMLSPVKDIAIGLHMITEGEGNYHNAEEATTEEVVAEETTEEVKEETTESAE